MMQTVGAFVKAARRVHPFLQYTKTSDTLWSRYIQILPRISPVAIIQDEDTGSQSGETAFS